MTRSLLIILSLTVVASALSSCGIKPHDVDAPPGEAAQQFPHIYPPPTGEAPGPVTDPSNTQAKKDMKSHGTKL
jgi:hypothetical protein